MAWGQRSGIGLLQGVALYTGAVLGAGVLTFPALAARQAGPASLLAWAGLVLLSVPLASTFAALAGRYPDAGGVATFAARAFGPPWAAVTGWWFYCTVPVGVPVLGLFGGAYVAAATGGGRTTSLAVGVALVAVAVAANWVGLRLSGRLQLVLAALLAALLTAAIAASAPDARTANLYPFAPHGWFAVGGAAALLVWSFAGWETVTHLAAEFADPARDLRRATAASLTLIGALYLGLAAVSVLVLGPRLEQVDAPARCPGAASRRGCADGHGACGAVRHRRGRARAGARDHLVPGRDLHSRLRRRDPSSTPRQPRPSRGARRDSPVRRVAAARGPVPRLAPGPGNGRADHPPRPGPTGAQRPIRHGQAWCWSWSRMQARVKRPCRLRQGELR